MVSGRGVIRFRDMNDPNGEVVEYFVSGEKMEVIDIPTGYTHNIENLGEGKWSRSCGVMSVSTRNVRIPISRKFNLW